MQEEIIKKNTQEPNTARNELINKLIEYIECSKNYIEVARINFNRVYNPDDIDIYIYKLRSAESRYTKLMALLLQSQKSPRHRILLTLLQQKRVYSISQTPRVLHHRLSVQQLRPVLHRVQALRQASTLSQTAT